MPDITMCTNKDCQLSKDCYRFNAVPSGFQSYQKFNPFPDEEGKIICDFFIEPKVIENEKLFTQSEN